MSAADPDGSGDVAGSGSGVTVRIGTRASALALTQTTTVAEALAEAGGFDVDLVRVRTEGDVNRAPLTQIGGTGVFVTALRDALLTGECDVAVHSLKDLPSAPADGLDIACIPTRAPVQDALCARDGLTLKTLPAGAKVGTGSPRRAAQLRVARPDLQVVDLRGNVPTRLGAVESGKLDAVVLAAAGLERLGLTDQITELIDVHVMLPAPGQGALAVECRSSDLAQGSFDGALAEAMNAYDDAATRLAVTAERALLARLEAGCSAPIGALAHVDPDGSEGSDGSLTLEAVVAATDGSRVLRREETAALGSSCPGQDLETARALGTSVAEALLDDGASDFMDTSAGV